MPIVEKENRKEYLSEYVVDVPQLIRNRRNATSYELLQLLGSGTYCKCYQVARVPTKEPFACRILNNEMIVASELKYLVENEIAIHRKLKHKHIVEFLDAFEDHRFIYIIQSLCSNNSLKDLQLNRELIYISECRYFVNQILLGAEYMQEKGIIHRDIKLSNILLDDKMQIKIGDFGLAVHVDDPRLKNKSTCGTTNYLAPEVINRKGFSYLSDVWAIGVVTYALRFGCKPFEEDDLYQTHQRIVKADYEVPSCIEPDLKDFLRTIFETDVELRPNATDCLKHDFFSRYVIPDTIPMVTLSEPYDVNEHLKELSPIINVRISSTHSSNHEINYPELCIVSESTLEYSYKNAKYAQVLENIFDHFNALCRFHTIDSDNSLTDINEYTDHPNYWISKWSLHYDNKFMYEICDGSVGLLFEDCQTFIKTPNGCYWVLKPAAERPHEISTQLYKNPYYETLQQFMRFELDLRINGIFEAETPYNRTTSPHLYAWFQTSEAMIMLLSNDSIQINFNNHNKMLICPKNESLTLINGKATFANFKTIKYANIAAHGYSIQSFQTLKYATACVKHLTQKLQRSTKFSI